MADSRGAAPHETLTQTHQQDNPVGQVSFRFQRYRAAIDERLALLQNGSVIQQPVSFVHGLIAQQGGSAEVQEEGLAGGGKERMVITAFPVYCDKGICVLR